MAKCQQRSVSMNQQTAEMIRKVADIREISFSESLRTLVVFGYLRYMEMLQDLSKARGIIDGSEVEENWP